VRRQSGLAVLAAALACALAAPAAAAPRTLGPLEGRADAVIDLRTREGVELVRGQWRARAARLAEAEFRAVGPDLRPSGAPIRTHALTPHAGAAGFDDSDWEALEAGALEARRGAGRLSFHWYRIAVTIPDRIGGVDPTGATVVFEVVVDDYAEVWVDGRLPRALGQSGGSVIRTGTR